MNDIFIKLMLAQKKSLRGLQIRSLGLGTFIMDIQENTIVQDVKIHIARIFQKRSAQVKLLDHYRQLQVHQNVFQMDSLLFMLQLSENTKYPPPKTYMYQLPNQITLAKKILIQQLERPIYLWFQQAMIEKILLDQDNGVNQHLGYIKNIVSKSYVSRFALYLMAQTDINQYYSVQGSQKLLETKFDYIHLAAIMIKWNFQPSQDHVFFRYVRDAGVERALQFAQWINIDLNYNLIACAKLPRVSMIVQAKFGYDKLFEQKMKQVGVVHLCSKQDY